MTYIGYCRYCNRGYWKKKMIFKGVKILQTVIVDVDEILLQWWPAFRKYCKDKGHDVPNDVPSIEAWFGKDLGSKLVNSFNDNEELFAYLKPYEDSVSTMKNLYMTGLEIIAITACGNGRNRKNSREYNLKREFGDIFSDIICVDKHKDEKLKMFKPSWFIDDSWRHIMSGLKANHVCIHLPRVYDKDKSHDDVFSVNTMYEAEKIISTVLKSNRISKVLNLDE